MNYVYTAAACLCVGYLARHYQSWIIEKGVALWKRVTAMLQKK